MIDPTGLHVGGHDAIADAAAAWKDFQSEHKEASEPLPLGPMPLKTLDLNAYHPQKWSDGIWRKETPLEGQQTLKEITPHMDIHLLGTRVFCARPMHY